MKNLLMNILFCYSVGVVLNYLWYCYVGCIVFFAVHFL